LRRTFQESFVDDHEDPRFTDLKLFNRKLADWLVFYNAHRPHHSLGQRSPLSFLLYHQPECQKYFTHTRTFSSGRPVLQFRYGKGVALPWIFSPSAPWDTPFLYLPQDAMEIVMDARKDPFCWKSRLCRKLLSVISKHPGENASPVCPKVGRGRSDAIAGRMTGREQGVQDFLVYLWQVGAIAGSKHWPSLQFSRIYRGERRDSIECCTYA
jgi:hypothetical protein